jgi:pilus assembly protein CpaF
MELRQRIAAVRDTEPEPERDAFAEVKDRIHAALIAQLGPVLANTDLDVSTLRERVRSDIRARLAQERGIALADRDRLVDEITDDTLGHGPLEKLLADESVTEIMVNGPHDVWIERKGRLY